MNGCEKIIDGKQCSGGIAFTGWDIQPERAVLKCNSCGHVTLGEKRVKLRNKAKLGRIAKPAAVKQ